MNTYTGLEWGNGNENETTFAPTKTPNPKQWLEAAKAAGMKGGYAGQTNWATDSRNDENNNEEGTEDYWLWNPGESDVCATDKGWFWHQGEQPKSAEQLFTYYMQTVGRNATLILNLPPDRSGELPQATVSRMEELGQLISDRLGHDYALSKSASVTASSERSGGYYGAQNACDGNKDTYWATDDGITTGTLTIGTTQTIRYMTLQEYVRLGQRVQAFNIEYSTDGQNWKRASSQEAMTTIGYKRIIPLNGSVSGLPTGYKARYVRVNITQSKACPLLQVVGVQ